MISGFQSISTINSGLILQELEQDVTASNLAQPSLDSQGYLMNSLETINTGTGPSVSFNGINGLLSVGTGVTEESITRLRNAFLDGQIRQQSTLVGYNEILANTSGTGVLNQISNILDPSSTGTLNYALTQFTNAWSVLGSAANNTAATDATDRANVVSTGEAFAQTANQQFDSLNALQLSTNGQIQTTVGQINQLLQELAAINKQLGTTQGSNQNTLLDARDYALDKLSRLINFNVTFGNNGTASIFLNGLSLLDSAGAATFGTNVSNPADPSLVGITLTSSTGTPAGDDEIIYTSVSSASIAAAGNVINPTATLASQSAKFATPPASGTIVINGVIIPYNTGQSLNTIINNIDAQYNKTGVTADYDAVSQQITLVSGAPITITNGAGNFLTWANITTNGANVANYTTTTTLINNNISSYITGGNLGGELQANNVILQSYKAQLNQVVDSVMNIANSIHSAGFAADGATTGTLLFTGSQAGNIALNPVIQNNNGLLAESSVATNAILFPGAPAAADKLIAQAMGNLQSLMPENFAASATLINNGVGMVNPYQPLDTQPFAAAIGPELGSFTLDGTVINYDTTIDTISTILQKMNAVPGITAVFDYTNQLFYVFSDAPVNIANGGGLSGAGNPPFAGNGVGWSNITNFMVSTLGLNNSFVPNDPSVDLQSSSLDGYFPTANGGPNIQAFQVTPSVSGSFYVNGVPVFTQGAPWVEADTLENIVNQIGPTTPYGTTNVNPEVTNIAGTLPTFFGGNLPVLGVILESDNPMIIDDTTGNFTAFTGLNVTGNIGSLSAGFAAQTANTVSNQESLTTQEQDALNQLNTSQANLAGVYTGSGSPASTASGVPTASTAGVPLASIQQQATQAATAYNALLEIMQVIDNMYQNLINIVGGGAPSSNSNNNFVG
jgi:flagellar hook-associated protein FlgK